MREFFLNKQAKKATYYWNLPATLKNNCQSKNINFCEFLKRAHIFIYQL